MDMKRKNQKVVGASLAVVFIMLGAAYASVPLYDLFCRVTGYGGTTNVATSSPSSPVLASIASEAGRKITIRFDASLNRNMPWSFEAPPQAVVLNVGEQGLVFYTAHNLADKQVHGTATYNVAPAKAGYYFTKIDCFCFTQQTLAAGQVVDMPVTFYIDPEILDDPEMDDVDTITLSYTFFETPNTRVDTGTPKIGG